jgi:polysaccharide export outer membrane protein
VVSVTVKQINSRKIYVIGMVAKPGPYNTTGPLTVLQLIALAGGLQEFADEKNIVVIRNEAGNTLSYKVNYADLSKGKNLGQNIELRPGDTVIVR